MWTCTLLTSSCKKSTVKMKSSPHWTRLAVTSVNDFRKGLTCDWLHMNYTSASDQHHCNLCHNSILTLHHNLLPDVHVLRNVTTHWVDGYLDLIDVEGCNGGIKGLSSCTIS